MSLLTKIKAITADSRKVDFYARWAVRLLLFVGVAYLVFFKDAQKETIFIPQENYHDTLTVLDYQLIEVTRRDSVIKVHKYEIITRNDSLPDDSLKQSILRAIKR